MVCCHGWDGSDEIVLVVILDYIVDRHPVGKLWKNGEGIESWGGFAGRSLNGWLVIQSVSQANRPANQPPNEHHHRVLSLPWAAWMTDPSPSHPLARPVVYYCFLCNSLWFILRSVFMSEHYWVKCKTWLHWLASTYSCPVLLPWMDPHITMSFTTMFSCCCGNTAH